jgi:endonuclease/exonuclease/phosphatase family metal-dependent hydrolase
MYLHSGVRLRCLFLSSLFCGASFLHTETFRVATYNLESYLDEPTATRPVKSVQAKAKVRECIRALQPDVIALQEMGKLSALDELQQSLKTEGLDLPYAEHISGFDTNIHIAILSKFPFVARRSHTNENFLLGGRRFRVSRGFGEVDIQVNAHYSFTLLTAHLKSKRTSAEADEAELRLEEAKLLREKIDAQLDLHPNVNLVVLGDFNDSKEAASTKAIVGRGKRKLVDTRPAEGNGESSSATVGGELRAVNWTHYYGKEDTFSRIDFILLSPGMAREWMTNETFVLATNGWGLASDHRPLVATFQAEDR